ncbi:hypothetical protein ES319_D09G060400v1 [Gossypium barbadense]|uniref:Uncharacterized protein n=1 Tax=Gossypium barbadense TaxID=3634 RepID=A0A5J5PZH9_GOSBA|nr:hypothetical protein ES319_D09G060400v1 [Gossypium barbadense]
MHKPPRQTERLSDSLKLIWRLKLSPIISSHQPQSRSEMSLAKSRIKIYANDLVLWGSLFKSRKVFEHLTLAIRPIFNDLGEPLPIPQIGFRYHPC